MVNLALDFDATGPQKKRTGRPPKLLAAMFPGKMWKELTKAERRAYDREHALKNPHLKLARLPKMRATWRAYAQKNKARIAEYRKGWSVRNKDKWQVYYRRGLLKQYGLTLEIYDAMLAMQGGGCALCGRPDIGRGNRNKHRLAVDHCHSTGKVRGLLCHQCNMVLGHCRDNPDLLRKAASYVESHAAAASQH